MARYHILHRTAYEFADWADGCDVLTLLRPQANPAIGIESHYLSTIPLTSRRMPYRDRHGNEGERLVYRQKVHRLLVSASTTVRVDGPAPAPTDAPAPLADEDALLPDAAVRDACRAFAAINAVDDVHAVGERLARRIHAKLIYDPSSDTVGRPIAAVLEAGRGICQDFARLAVAVLRAHAIPARCVVGYALPGTGRHPSPHASLRWSHAWFSVWSPDSGWRDFDATERDGSADGLLTLAHAPVDTDITPVRGELGSDVSGQSLAVEVMIDRLPDRASP